MPESLRVYTEADGRVVEARGSYDRLTIESSAKGGAKSVTGAWESIGPLLQSWVGEPLASAMLHTLAARLSGVVRTPELWGEAADGTRVGVTRCRQADGWEVLIESPDSFGAQLTHCETREALERHVADQVTQEFCHGLVAGGLP